MTAADTADTDLTQDVWRTGEGLPPEERARYWDDMLRQRDAFLAARDRALTEVYLSGEESFDDMSLKFGRSPTTIRTAVNRYKREFPHLAGRRRKPS